MNCCLACSNLGEYNTSQTGRVCNASVRGTSPVSQFVVYNLKIFCCSMFEQKKQPVKIDPARAFDQKESGHGRAKAAGTN